MMITSSANHLFANKGFRPVPCCRIPSLSVTTTKVQQNPREDLNFRREPPVEAIESAFLHENGAREVLQVVGEHLSSGKTKSVNSRTGSRPEANGSEGFVK